MDQNKLDVSWLYQATSADICLTGISSGQAQLVVAGLRDHIVLENELQAIEKYAITLMIEEEPLYSSNLRAIYAPPAVLYVKGAVDIFNDRKFVAVVGSRQANVYGRSVIESLVPVITQAHCGVVSGGARGIDAYAHKVALQQGGITIAVLGSGLLKPYPSEHKNLFAEIAEKGGAVISPFPLYATALPGNFPARNRIIAGISQSCIVAQAAEKSGALITASYALAEGRDVGAVPGSIFDPLSAGCHKLLRDGATPIISGDDLKIFLGEEIKTAAPIQSSIPQAIQDYCSQDQQIPVSCDPIIQACTVKARSFDELLPYVQGSSDTLYSRLWDLQLQGKISQTMTGLWQSTQII